MAKRQTTIQSWLSWMESAGRRRCPGQLVIQLTDQCNAQCPQCGMRAGERFQRSSLNLHDLKGILDQAARLGFKAVSLTGGEPMLRMPDVLRLARYARKVGIPLIRSGTNGFQFRRLASESPQAFQGRIKNLVDDIAGSPLRNFWISLDSCLVEEHERMRGFPGVVDGIRKALPLFHAQGFYPSANLGINRNMLGARTRALRYEDFSCDEDYLDAFEETFYEAFCRFYAFVIDLGFTIVNACYPMSFADLGEQGGEAVYSAASSDRIVCFDRQEKQRLFHALFCAVEAYRSRIRIFTPLVSLQALIRQYSGEETQWIYPCRGGLDYFYINAADGHVYPCGYRGQEDLGDFTALAQLPDPSSVRDCFLCDWECFRDPSELTGPVIDVLRSPLRLWRRYRDDSDFLRLWMRDLHYYHAAQWFSARRPMDLKRLSRFRTTCPRPEVKHSAGVSPAFDLRSAGK